MTARLFNATMCLVALALCSCSAEESCDGGQCSGSSANSGSLTSSSGNALIQGRFTKKLHQFVELADGVTQVFGRELTAKEVADAMKTSHHPHHRHHNHANHNSCDCGDGTSTCACTGGTGAANGGAASGGSNGAPCSMYGPAGTFACGPTCTSPCVDDSDTNTTNDGDDSDTTTTTDDLPQALDAEFANDDPLANTMIEVETLNNGSALSNEAHDVEEELKNGSDINVDEALDAINKAAAEETVDDAIDNGAIITSAIIAKIVGENDEDKNCEGANDSMCHQGDMEAANQSHLSLLQAGVKHAGTPWTDGNVKYCFASDLHAQTQQLFERSTVQITSAVPCITFQNVGNPSNAGSYSQQKSCGEANAIFVQSQSDEGCYSYVGMTGGTQKLNLKHPGCSVLGTVIHEIGHALGMGHEQARPDRNSKVTIHWENIQGSKASNFVLNNNEDTSEPYDYTSIMHYGAEDFTIQAGLKTISTPGGAHDSTLGERIGLGHSDAKQLATHYGCTASNIHADHGCVDTDPSYCGMVSQCGVSEHLQKCCGCGGGLEYQCWGSGACPTRESQKLPTNPAVADCIKDRTSDFHGYTCVIENKCDFQISYKVNGQHQLMDMAAKMCCSVPPASHHGVCRNEYRVVSKSPQTPAPTPAPTPPTPEPTPSPTQNHAHCMKDVTTDFGGAYPCVLRKKCDYDLKVVCSGYPTQFWTWTGPTTSNGGSLPPFGKETCEGKCTVSKTS